MSVKFNSITIKRISPFHDNFYLPLSPYITFIRGQNGAGKTTLLECLAMFGHCPVMEVRRKDPFQQCEIVCTFEGVDAQKEAYGQEISEDFLMEIMRLTKPFSLTIFPVSKSDKAPGPIQLIPDLKIYLADEEMLRTNWCMWSDDDGVIAKAFQKLIRFSRPEAKARTKTDRIERIIEELKKDPTGSRNFEILEKHFFNPEPEKFQPATRTIHLKNKTCDSRSLPGFITYINTDMYQWGIGLDIRESPKDMRKELPQLIKYRLNLTDNNGALLNSEKVLAFWNRVFEFKERESIATENAPAGRMLKEVSIDDQDQGVVKVGGDARIFLSSGENQILFLGLMLEAMEARRSVFLLDEPELHTDIGSAKKLYDELFKNTAFSYNQFIIVSHMPFIFERCLAPVEGLGTKRRFVVDLEAEKVVGLVFIDSERKPHLHEDAVRRIALVYNRELRSIEIQMRKSGKQIRFRKLPGWMAKAIFGLPPKSSHKD